MKRIALGLAAAALSLGAGAALAATPMPSTSASSHAVHRSTIRPNDSSSHRMTEALNLLEAKGYGSFTDFKAAGNAYTALVTQNGHHVTVRVNPDSGQVTTVG